VITDYLQGTLQLQMFVFLSKGFETGHLKNGFSSMA